MFLPFGNAPSRARPFIRRNIICAAGGPEALREANSREWMGRLLALFGAEFGDHIGRDGGTADLFGVVLVARRPDAGFRALHGQFAVNRKTVFDVEAGAAELAHPRGHLDGVAELNGLEKIDAGIDQGDADDAERICQLMRLHAERGLEHAPGAGVEDLEETAVEHDAGRIALAPFDAQRAAIGERHAGCLTSHNALRYTDQTLICHARAVYSARPRESGDPGQHVSAVVWPWIPAFAGMSGV